MKKNKVSLKGEKNLYNESETCPNCKVSLLKDFIGIDGGYMGIYDGIVAFRCPDCGHECPRNKSEWV